MTVFYLDTYSCFQSCKIMCVQRRHTGNLHHTHILRIYSCSRIAKIKTLITGWNHRINYVFNMCFIPIFIWLFDWIKLNNKFDFFCKDTFGQHDMFTTYKVIEVSTRLQSQTNYHIHVCPSSKIIIQTYYVILPTRSYLQEGGGHRLLVLFSI